MQPDDEHGDELAEVLGAAGCGVLWGKYLSRRSLFCFSSSI